MTRLTANCRLVLRHLGDLPVELRPHLDTCEICTTRVRTADRVAAMLRSQPAITLDAEQSAELWSGAHELGRDRLQERLQERLGRTLVARSSPLPIRSGAILTAAYASVLASPEGRRLQKVLGEEMSPVAMPAPGTFERGAGQVGLPGDAEDGDFSGGFDEHDPEPAVATRVAAALVPTRTSPGWIWSRLRWELRALRSASRGELVGRHLVRRHLVRPGRGAVPGSSGAGRAAAWILQAAILAAVLVASLFLIRSVLPDGIRPRPEPLRAFQILDVDRPPLPGYMPEQIMRRAVAPEATGAAKSMDGESSDRQSPRKGEAPRKGEEDGGR
jgi:hypothetical protein